MSEFIEDKVIAPEECLEIVRKKLIEESIDDFRLVDYKVKSISETHGLMGQYFKLKVIVAYPKTSSQTHIYNFFVKIPAPPSSPQYAWNQEFGSFKKEVELYTKVFPEVLNGLEKRLVPGCFLGIHGNEKIVLDDMSAYGYKMPDKFIPFNLEHCLVALKTLAKFHSKSIIFEELKKKSLYEEFPQCMNECLWQMKEGMAERNFDAAVKGVVSLIDLMEEIDDLERSKFKQRILELSKDHRKKLLPSTKFKNVYCHGDLWANNILFQYDDKGNPLACCLVDFQLCRYNPPAHDILLFLHFTTMRSFRKNHAENLFKIYWEQMAESLKDAGLEPSTVFPWKEFINSINDLRTMCIAHCVLNSTVILLEPSAASKYFNGNPELLDSVFYVDRTPMIFDQFHKVPQYRERMLDALQELYESS